MGVPVTDAVGTTWISVHDGLPVDSRECVLICVGPKAKGDPIEKSLGFRFQNEWIILSPELKGWEVRYWLPLPDMP